MILKTFSIFATLIVAAATTASAAVWSANGHTYQLIDAPGISWDDARLDAIAMGGYLATIESQAEEDFIQANVLTAAAFSGPFYTHWQGGPWIGGRTVPLAEIGSVWHWVNPVTGDIVPGDDQFWENPTALPALGGSGTALGYENWLTGIPDDEPNGWLFSSGDEFYLGYVKYDGALGWGDWDSSTYILGADRINSYILEITPPDDPPPPPAVPEPTALAVWGLGGMLAFGFRAYPRRRRST